MGFLIENEVDQMQPVHGPRHFSLGTEDLRKGFFAVTNGTELAIHRHVSWNSVNLCMKPRSLQSSPRRGEFHVSSTPK